MKSIIARALNDYRSELACATILGALLGPGCSPELNSHSGISPHWNFSDARLKANVSQLEHSLDKIVQIQGITFTWKDPKKMNDDREQIGFLAQDVEKVFPAAVSKGDGYKTVAYSMLIAPAVEAIKELNAKIEILLKSSDEQTKGVASVATENALLKARIERLEKLFPQK